MSRQPDWLEVLASLPVVGGDSGQLEGADPGRREPWWDRMRARMLASRFDRQIEKGSARSLAVRWPSTRFG